MKGITLIGMPGVGKSTIGRKLAYSLGWKFIDLDVVIKEKEGKSHAEIAREKGDAELLRLENKHALELDLAGSIFSPGGSIVYSKEAMEKILQETRVFYLARPFSEIKNRIGSVAEKRGIVGFAEKGLEGLFLERVALYSAFADHVINCKNLNDEEVIKKINALLQHQS